MPEMDSLLQFSTAFHGGWQGILCTVLLHFAMEPLRWVVYLGRDPMASFALWSYIFSSTAFFSYVLPAKLGIPFAVLAHHEIAGALGASAVGCGSWPQIVHWQWQPGHSPASSWAGSSAFRVGSDYTSRSLWHGAFPWWVFSAMLPRNKIAMIAWRAESEPYRHRTEVRP